MIRMLVIAAASAAAVGCNKKSQQPPVASENGASAAGPGSASPPARAASPTSTSWTIESRAVEPRCGDRPLPLPPPVAPTEPPTDTKLAARLAIASCHDQPSVAATCRCLAGTIETWGKEDLSPKGECEAETTELDATAALVRVQSVSADPTERVPGQATIFVAKRGAVWSAIAVVATAADVKQRESPQGREKVTIDRTQIEPIAGGTLYWIEARNEEQNKRLGKLSVTGATEGTICRVTASDASCLAPVVLGAWSYGEPCTVRTLGLLHATVTPTTVTVRVEHGTQTEAIAGTYHL